LLGIALKAPLPAAHYNRLKHQLLREINRRG
jgi:hypothetical protein